MTTASHATASDWVGQIVHFTDYADGETPKFGRPLGEGASKVCRPAVVAEQSATGHADVLGLEVGGGPIVAVHAIADGGVRYDGIIPPKCEPGPSGRPVGTWHFEGACG
jgi:hypothetical protein